MSLKDIDIGIKEIKSMLLNDIEKQLKFLGITYDKIYTLEEIKDIFDVNRKYKRNQILDVLMNECESDEAGLLLRDIEIRKKVLKKFIRECAFDYINKFCAIRLLEERNLISPAIKKFKEYGDKSEVQKNLSQISYSLLDKDPYDGLKDAIEGTLRELSTQIKILFELNDEHSLVFPEPKTIKEITKILLYEIPLEDWQRDDFIGWTYQYFVEDEKEEIEQADTPEEIATKTQVYTYHWIVKYIVDNTLGSYWNEIKSGKRAQQEVETIKLIDPSCGSGSFLTYAFDKYYELYKEEGKVSEEEIPNYIISKNIFGMDIDERAVQLAALNLYIKAKQKNRNVQIEKFNIICTDSRIKEEVNIKKYLMSLSVDPKLRDVIENIVKQSFDYMRENNLLGSLMKIEDVINPIIDEYIGGRRRPSIREVESKKERVLKQSQAGQITLFKPEVEQLSIDSIEEIRYFESREEFVKYLRGKILDCVDYVITKINKSNDINSRMFAKDLAEGSSFIGAMMQMYEVVVGNPPYLTSRKMGLKLLNKVEEQYKLFKHDLYSSFIVKSINITGVNNYIGLLTPTTYTILKSYKELRNEIISNCKIDKLLVLGKDVFSNVAVDVSITILQKTILETCKNSFYDLSNINDKLLPQNMENRKYVLETKIIRQIPELRFIYWASEDIIKILVECEKLEPKFADVRQGLATGDNNRFVLMRWEVPQNRIEVKWIPYSKGGGYSKYYGINYFVLNWGNNGQELKSFSKEKYGSITRRIANQKYYFKEGLSFSLITSNNRFSCRYMPKGWIFDSGGSCIFTNECDLKVLLGKINSKLINYLVSLLNPTVNFQVGDIKGIPIKNNCKYDIAIKELTNLAIILKIQLNKFNILSELFDEKIFYLFNKTTIFQGYKDYFQYKSKCLILLEECSFLIDEFVFELYGINSSDREKVLLQFGYSPAGYGIIGNCFINPNIGLNFKEEDIEKVRSLEETKDSVINDYSEGINLIEEYYGKKLRPILNLSAQGKENHSTNLDNIVQEIRQLLELKDMDVIEISQELKINPRTTMYFIDKYKLYSQKDIKDTVLRYLQTIARKAFDNDSDGIVLLPEVLNKIHDELDKTFGDNASSIETEIINIIGKNIEKWLRDDFAIDYINNKGYDKKKDKYDEIKNPWEPLIWKGQSTKKNFTVFVWRYKITPDTELKIRSQYLEGEIDSYKNKIKELDERLSMLEGKEKDNLEKERDEIFYTLDDLNDYKEWIKENGIKLRGMWFNWE